MFVSTEGTGMEIYQGSSVLVILFKAFQPIFYFWLKYPFSVQNFPTSDMTDLTDNIVRWLEANNTESTDPDRVQVYIIFYHQWFYCQILWNDKISGI